MKNQSNILYQDNLQNPNINIPPINVEITSSNNLQNSILMKK